MKIVVVPWNLWHALVTEYSPEEADFHVTLEESECCESISNRSPESSIPSSIKSSVPVLAEKCGGKKISHKIGHGHRVAVSKAVVFPPWI